jgi:hypothetical protein
MLEAICVCNCCCTCAGMPAPTVTVVVRRRVTSARSECAASKASSAATPRRLMAEVYHIGSERHAGARVGDMAHFLVIAPLFS